MSSKLLLDSLTIDGDVLVDAPAGNSILTGGGTSDSAGQAFTGDGLAIGSASFVLRSISGSPSTAVASIYAISGTYGTSAIPTGTALATSDTLDISTLTGTYKRFGFVFSGVNQITLTNGTNYFIAIRNTGVGALGMGQATSSIHNGNVAALSAGTWTASATQDAYFAIASASTTDALLLEDGTSYLLLENDVQVRQFVQYSGTASQTNMTFTLPNAPVVGNLLIANILYATADDPFRIPTGWTLQNNYEPGSVGIATIYRWVQAGDTASWNLTVLTSADQNSGFMWEIMGADPTTPFNQYNKSFASATTSIATPSITPSVLNTLVLGMAVTDGTTSSDVAVASGSWSKRMFAKSTFQPAWAFQLNGYTSDTTTGQSTTISGMPSGQIAAVIMAIAPVGGGGGAPVNTGQFFPFF